MTDASEAATSEAPKRARGRPRNAEGDGKTRISIMLDDDLLADLRASGPGWQTRANAILRDAVLEEAE